MDKAELCLGWGECGEERGCFPIIPKKDARHSLELRVRGPLLPLVHAGPQHLRTANMVALCQACSATVGCAG